MMNLFDQNKAGLEASFAAAGQAPFRARQVMKWLYHKGCRDFSEMTDLAKELRAWLDGNVSLSLPEIVGQEESADGTVKWGLRVANGDLVEMVLIPEPGRNTLCVSSQAGCMLDCSFCATGKQGFNGNLSTAEIVGQVWLANHISQPRGQSISNVVFMGMGEPLLNLEAVLPAVSLLVDDLGFGLSRRRVTISTAGVVPGILALTGVVEVSLALSLHAPDDALRDQLVPLNRKYPIAEVLAACKHYLASLHDKRSLTVEYTLIQGVNDAAAQSGDLVRLLRGLRCKINLIPFNPHADSQYRRPSQERMRVFQKTLLDAGYAAMLRKTRGDDINAACGQLAGSVSDRTRRQARYAALAEGTAEHPLTVV